MERIEHEDIKEFSEIDWTDNRQFILEFKKDASTNEYMILINKFWRNRETYEVSKKETQWYKCPYLFWMFIHELEARTYKNVKENAIISTILNYDGSHKVELSVGGMFNSNYYKKIEEEINDVYFKIEIQP